MEVGRKIYYELNTGNPILDTGERSGEVVKTSKVEDFATYVDLRERAFDTVGVVELAYGDLRQDFNECSGYRVDITQTPHKLVFSYPDPGNPGTPPVYQAPLSVQVAELKDGLIAAQVAINMLLGV